MEIKYPIYLPDATRGFVKSLSGADLQRIGIQGVVVNTFHLINSPGKEFLQKLGGVKKFMNFDGFVTSDSGGWQIYSLLHKRNKGYINDDGVCFYEPLSDGSERKTFLTPEDSIEMQLAIKPDLLVCLDDFTSPTATEKQQQESVERTILWARHCKEYFKKATALLTNEEKPKLMAVIQGGFNKSQRLHCIEKLAEIGFDAYGYGGYAVKPDDNNLDYDLSEFIAENLPKGSLKFALGVGRPLDLVKLTEMGWDIFDCTLPTRDARHKRLYIFGKTQEESEFLYINKIKYASDLSPIDPTCTCETCTTHTRAYLHHLFKMQDPLSLRLATIHNLTHYVSLTRYLQAKM